MLIYQPSRAGRVDGTGEAGSAQWDAAFRARTYLQPDKDERDVRRLVRKKSNFSAKDEEIKIRWEKGVFVRADANPAKPAYEVMAQRAKAERVFLSQLDQYTSLNWDVSASKNSPNYAPRRFAADADRNDGCTLEEFEKAMTVLMFDKHAIYISNNGRSKRLERVVTGNGDAR